VAIFDTIHHNPVNNGILCLTDEDGKEGMEDSTAKKGAPGSLVDFKRDLYPWK
jgi:hypothetical protein